MDVDDDEGLRALFDLTGLRGFENELPDSLKGIVLRGHLDSLIMGVLGPLLW